MNKLSGPMWGSWIGTTPTIQLYSPETLKQLVRDDAIERLRVDEFVDLFLDIKQLMEDLNEALAKVEAK